MEHIAKSPQASPATDLAATSDIAIPPGCVRCLLPGHLPRVQVSMASLVCLRGEAVPDVACGRVFANTRIID